MLIIGAPFVGTRKTSTDQLTISLRFPYKGQTVSIVSDSGDCAVTITASTIAQVNGSFSCRYVHVAGNRLVDLSGNFVGKAKIVVVSP